MGNIGLQFCSKICTITRFKKGFSCGNF